MEGWTREQGGYGKMKKRAIHQVKFNWPVIVWCILIGYVIVWCILIGFIIVWCILIGYVIDWCEDSWGKHVSLMAAGAGSCSFSVAWNGLPAVLKACFLRSGSCCVSVVYIFIGQRWTEKCISQDELNSPSFPQYWFVCCKALSTLLAWCRWQLHTCDLCPHTRSLWLPLIAHRGYSLLDVTGACRCCPWTCSRRIKKGREREMERLRERETGGRSTKRSRWQQ